MKAFIGFIIKEFYHIFRDKKTLLILFGMPIAQILIFGYGVTNEIRNAKIAIYDNAKDNESEKLINKVASSGYFQIVSMLNSYKEIDGEFKRGNIKLALVIDDSFSEDLVKTNRANVQVVVDASEPNMASSLINYISSVILDYNKEINIAIENKFIVSAEVYANYNPEMKGVYMFVPGLITIILMLVSALMTSISITKEKETGSMEILLSSPMNPYLVIVSKIIPYMLLSFIDAIIIMLVGVFVFSVPINGSIVLLMSECLLFISTALALGIFISTKTSSQQTALMISLVGLMMPTILLSGFVFPIDNMPKWLQYLTVLNPGRWFMIIVRGIMLKGDSLAIIWKETLILAGFTMALLLLSIKNFKLRLE